MLICIHVFVLSTGYSSKYGTYSFQDDATKEIVHYERVQVNNQVIIVWNGISMARSRQWVVLDNAHVLWNKTILLLLCFQVTEVSSSVVMEAMGFQRGLDHLLSLEIDIGVMATDRSPSIRKLMRESYANICHEYDPWHVNKSKYMYLTGFGWWNGKWMASYLMLLTYVGVKKKLVAASNKKDNRELQP